MKIAVTSTVILDVATDMSQEQLAKAIRDSNEFAVGKDWVTVSGIPYRFEAIEKFAVEVRR